MANTGVNLLWEPDAKNQAKNRLLAALQDSTSSEPGAQGPGTGYGGGVSPGGGTIADLAQQDVSNVENQQLPADYVARLAQDALAQGRKDPNISDLLKLAAAFPELAVQEAVQAAISGFTLPGDVASGKQQLTDPTTGHITDQSLGRVLDLTGLAASGSVAGPAEAAAGDLLGSGPVRAPKPEYDPNYMYHVTGEQRLVDIQDEGKLRTYSPDHGTDQSSWPDGGTENRSYWSAEAPNDSFYDPDHGPMAVIRAPKTALPFKRERGTPDYYLKDHAPVKELEFLKPDGTWQAINSGSKEQAAVAEVAGQAPELYSHAARVVDALPAGKASGAQWISTLKNKGVKDEELEALNLPADGTLTKDQLKAHIDANTPQPKDVVKGGDTRHPQYTQDDVDNEEAHARRTGDWTRFEEVQAEYEAQQLGHGTAARYDEDYQGNPTKYSQYQLPGGTNYREIVTTLPKKGELTEAEQTDYKALAQRVGSVPPGLSLALTPAEGARYRGYLNRIGSVAADPNTYRSSHWDEPNVLAHTRVNDRVIPEEGFSVYNRASGNKSPVFATRAEAEAYLENLPASLKQGNTQIIGDHKPVKTLHAEELQSDWHQAGKKSGYVKPDEFANTPEGFAQQAGAGKASGVPDAPFKKTWPDLLIKKLALRAHNEGYDAISWTDGAAQAERYRLSRQVSSVGVTRNEDGTFNLRAAPIGADRNVQIGRSVAPERLPDLVGKDLADRIIGDDLKPGFVNKQYEGDDLKAGGEGLKAFYDQELPRRAKKILGAPVEKRKIKDGINSEPYTPSVHFVRLTPEVRDRIKKGFPLFASGAPVPAQAQTDPTPKVGQTRTMRFTRVPAIPQAGAPTIDRTHDVPAFAGSSNDNKTVYVDRHVPTQMNIDGKVIDPAKYLQVHEQFEHDLMANRKLPYDVAHKQATAAERAAVEADGIDWKSYEAHINGMLHAIETEPLKDEPDDLYTKVYHTPEWGKRASEIDRATHRRHIDTRIK